MAFVTKDRIKVTSTTTGTGVFALGAAAVGYQDFSGIGEGNQTYYTITNGTDWEVGIGTLTSSGTTLSRNLVLASSNSNALVDWVAGSKVVYVPQPAENTQGSAPTGDNSSIGTDQVAFDNFQKNLFQSINAGVTFYNNNVTGIGRTYSLVYTLNIGYYGGVLAPNGDIHSVPYSAAVGQKITYSLVYTTTSAYAGGVLAPNGDIHFVPYNANRGQKISASGVVSTYSLVNAPGSGAYEGGVLAPNGDIHFVPQGATVGQKVSPAGVVSTYSLVYVGVYSGGVVAPNGDIHFVPQTAAVGQKVSAAGVVSTYSLVFTQTNVVKSNGGVLAPNGDIHFIPGRDIGQKISISGVVSTYSLVRTTTDSYRGGVLAPNGDIHFIPFAAGGTVGQKINTLSGVVSTYSLVYTQSTGYIGGILAPNGDIYFMPRSANRGHAISTNPATPFGLDTCLSSYLNKY